MCGACLKPSVQVGSSGDCVTCQRDASSSTHHLVGYRVSFTQMCHKLGLGSCLYRLPYTLALRETRMQVIFQGKVPQNNSLIRRCWEFCERPSARPGLSWQRLILAFSVLLHRMAPAPPHCSSAPLLHLYGSSTNSLYKSFLFQCNFQHQHAESCFY